MSDGFSPLATVAQRMKDVNDRTDPVFGVALHTTGGSLPEKAIKSGVDPLEFAVGYYTKADTEFFAHYVIGWDGTIVQVANEQEKALHIGLSSLQRQQYLSGAWKTMIPASVVALWRTAWPAFKSPSHLYPGPSPNNVYVGVEMIPIVARKAAPAGPGLRFTAAQHDSAAELAADVAKRHGFPAGWSKTPRLVGHEDVALLQRMDKLGGWDPGALRAAPYFDMARVRRLAEPQKSVSVRVTVGGEGEEKTWRS